MRHGHAVGEEQGREGGRGGAMATTTLCRDPSRRSNPEVGEVDAGAAAAQARVAARPAAPGPPPPRRPPPSSLARAAGPGILARGSDAAGLGGHGCGGGSPTRSLSPSSRISSASSRVDSMPPSISPLPTTSCAVYRRVCRWPRVGAPPSGGRGTRMESVSWTERSRQRHGRWRGQGRWQRKTSRSPGHGATAPTPTSLAVPAPVEGKGNHYHHPPNHR